MSILSLLQASVVNNVHDPGSASCGRTPPGKHCKKIAEISLSPEHRHLHLCRFHLILVPCVHRDQSSRFLVAAQRPFPPSQMRVRHSPPSSSSRRTYRISNV